MSSREFEGKTVIVTGAASGLGQAAALAFADAGAQLALADVDAEGLAATLAQVEAKGAAAITVLTDVSDIEACRNLVAQTVEKFGRLDSLCNVAGILRFDHAADVTPEAWDRVFAINVRGPFFTIQAALPHILASEGSIVNVASTSAFEGYAYLSAYGASKAALVNLTKSLAMEHMNKPIRINAIAPGGMKTGLGRSLKMPEGLDMQLLGRFMPARGYSDPEDLVDPILMLAGPRGKAFHGSCLNIDQGLTAG